MLLPRNDANGLDLRKSGSFALLCGYSFFTDSRSINKQYSVICIFRTPCMPCRCFCLSSRRRYRSSRFFQNSPRTFCKKCLLMYFPSRICCLTRKLVRSVRFRGFYHTASAVCVISYFIVIDHCRLIVSVDNFCAIVRAFKIFGHIIVRHMRIPAACKCSWQAAFYVY